MPRAAGRDLVGIADQDQGDQVPLRRQERAAQRLLLLRANHGCEQIGQRLGLFDHRIEMAVALHHSPGTSTSSNRSFTGGAETRAARSARPCHPRSILPSVARATVPSGSLSVTVMRVMSSSPAETSS